MTASWTLALVIVTSSALTVAGVLMLFAAFQRRPTPRPQTRMAQDGGYDPAFLIAGDTLVDSNAPGRDLLAALRPAMPAHRSDAHVVLDYVDRISPGARLAVEGMEPGGSLRRSGASVQVDARNSDGAIHIRLVDLNSETRLVHLDGLTYRAMQDELTLLRSLANGAPMPVWVEAEDGHVIWANGSYLTALFGASAESPLPWPLPELFPPTTPGETTRVSVPSAAPGGGQDWYDIARSVSMQGAMGFAVPANAVQRAETTKRDFVQTLTKTFSTLPIGLAVFDRARRMQMFNPAMVDLTGLEPEFLLSRPGIEGFFNRMREKHVMPEPRDYREWLRVLLAIDRSTPDFEESWSLPSGQTLRFCASPHPDGALAITIEDITTETHFSASQNALIETSQGALDMMETAIAVFAPSGQLLMINRAFSQLWTLDDETSLGSITLADALATWRDDSDDPGLWQAIADLAANRGGRTARDVVGETGDASSERLRVRAQLGPTGTLMICFDPLPGDLHLLAERKIAAAR